MKAISKVRITTTALIMGVLASFAGAITSTLAWYAYSTTATVSYKGTSIAQSEMLQIGIMTTLPKVNTNDPNEKAPTVEFSDEQIEEYGIEYATVEDKTYAFCRPGTGLSAELISHYLISAGYASNEMAPVTSQKFEGKTGEELSLKQHILSGVQNNNKIAEKAIYSVLPLAFRVGQKENDVTTYAKNQDIWLTSSKAIADGEGDVFKAVRAHFKSDLVNFIYNPSAKEAGYTTMGGLLDLNWDGIYDSASELNGNEREIVYGCYDGELPEAIYNENETEIDDVNKTGNHVYGTTFSAKHGKNSYIYNDLSEVKFHKGYYKSLKEIQPQTNASGFLSGGEVLCRTSDDENAIAELDVTVWLEGWDHSVIDSEINHKFALGLTFEVNRVL